FGVDVERVPELLDEIGRCGLIFEGFHIFSGSQNLRDTAICEAQEQAVDLAIRLARTAPMPVKTLNVGGGFGIPYFPGDEPLDLAPIGRTLRSLAARTAEALPGSQLAIELGRYLVGEAGLYVS